MRHQVCNAGYLCCCWDMTNVMATACCAQKDPMQPAFSLEMV